MKRVKMLCSMAGMTDDTTHRAGDFVVKSDPIADAWQEAGIATIVEALEPDEQPTQPGGEGDPEPDEQPEGRDLLGDADKPIGDLEDATDPKAGHRRKATAKGR